jgi:hypothetical protein
VGLRWFTHSLKYSIAKKLSHDEEVTILANLRLEEKCGSGSILSQKNPQAQSSDFDLGEQALIWHMNRVQWM